MIKIILLILVLLLPVSSEAAYKIYLKNGSVITGVSSYVKKGGEVTIYFNGGSMGISEKDILKTEEFEAPEKDISSKEIPEIKEKPQVAPSEVPVDDKSAKVNTLKAELDLVISDIRAAEEQEAKLVATINEKSGSRVTYNIIQLRQLEKELEPLRQELSAIQQKKRDLVQRKNSLEDEIKSLQ